MHSSSGGIGTLFSHTCQIPGFLGLIPHSFLLYKWIITVEPSFLSTWYSTAKCSEKLTMGKDTVSLQLVLPKRLIKRSKKLLGKIGTNIKAHTVPLKDYF